MQSWASLCLSVLVFKVGTMTPMSQVLFEDEGLGLTGELGSGNHGQRPPLSPTVIPTLPPPGIPPPGSGTWWGSGDRSDR